MTFPAAVDRFVADAGRGPLVAQSENYAVLMDSLIVCKFLRKCFDDFYSEAAELLGSITGWHCSSDELRRTGERMHTLKKLFNIRQGWRPEDDWLPQRLLSETLPTGVARGVGLTADELRAMIQGYYRCPGMGQERLRSEAEIDGTGLARWKTVQRSRFKVHGLDSSVRSAAPVIM